MQNANALASFLTDYLYFNNRQRPTQAITGTGYANSDLRLSHGSKEAQVGEIRQTRRTNSDPLRIRHAYALLFLIIHDLAMLVLVLSILRLALRRRSICKLGPMIYTELDCERHKEVDSVH